MKAFAITLLTISILFTGCTTKDGNIVSSQVGAGSVEITSTVPDARIFVDHKDTGKRTPAVIENLPEGSHVIHLFLGKYEVLPESARITITRGSVTAIDFELNKSPSEGNLQISTNPPGALVFVDKLPFGRTPLLIEGLLSGTHRLRIIRGGYNEIRETVQISTDNQVALSYSLELKHFVLIEHFSNTDCPPCPVADATIEAVLHDFGVDSAAGLTYHPNFPGSEDPLFLAAESDNLARMSFYRLLAVPTVEVDGVFTILSPNNLEPHLRDAMQTRFQVSPPATVDFHDFWETYRAPDKIAGSVVIDALEDLPSDVFLRIALIEKEVIFPTSPGTNGQTRFTDVLRKFFPNPDGTPISLQSGESQTVEFQFERQPEWQGDLEVIAFLQRNSNKEVLQAAWTVLE